MPDPLDKAELLRGFSPKTRFIGWSARRLILTWSHFLRWTIEDRAGVVESPPEHPIIWAIWHNRLFAYEGAHVRYFPERCGAVLTSASRDGEITAAFSAYCGSSASRGSSSRRGASALLGLTRWIEQGYDSVVVPDGPRGPRYRLQPGLVKLAQVSGAAIVPLRVEFGSYWNLKSWDRFRLPKPFARVHVVMEPCQFVESSLSPEEFEAERIRLEDLMNPDHETD